MKILVTAFGPFGNMLRNPSQTMLEAIDDAEIVKKVLPTSYTGAAEELRKAIQFVQPDFAVLTGVASGRSEVCLEFCALNIKDASCPDNDGELASGRAEIKNM